MRNISLHDINQYNSPMQYQILIYFIFKKLKFQFSCHRYFSIELKFHHFNFNEDFENQLLKSTKIMMIISWYFFDFTCTGVAKCHLYLIIDNVNKVKNSQRS